MEGWIQQAFECLQTATEHCAERKSPVEAEENKIEPLHLCKNSNFHNKLISTLIHSDGCAAQTVHMKKTTISNEQVMNSFTLCDLHAADMN